MPIICPACGVRLRYHARMIGDGGPQPEPGDWTICATCLTILQFQADRQLRALSEADVAALPPDDQRGLRHARRALAGFLGKN